MKIVNISEAKTNLSKLVALVYRGEKVVIAKNNLPLVDLVVHKPEGKRKLGLLAGKFVAPLHHKDPFDRMLVAQSIADSYPIMTEDPKIALYSCQVL